MLINYATTFDSKDIHSWSGLGYYIGKMLEEEGHDVSYLNRLQIQNAFYHSTAKYYLHKLFRKTYSPYFSIPVAQHFCNSLKKHLPGGSLIISPNTVLLAKLSGPYKKVLYTDATFNNLFNFYSSYSILSRKYLAQAQEIETMALGTADLLIYSSRWAAESAIRDYGVNPSKVAVVPFGANLDVKLSECELEQVITERLIKPEIHILFMGVCWERKGGDNALKVVQSLNRSGLKATLHVVGLNKIPDGIDRQYIVDHGFISKATIGGHRKLGEILRNSDFLLLPSVADCTPVAVSEACSFGLPSLLSDVGGNGCIVKQGINGYTFNFPKGTDECVDLIKEIKRDENAYRALCRQSYQRYISELNWQVSGQKVTALLNSIM